FGGVVEGQRASAGDPGVELLNRGPDRKRRQPERGAVEVRGLPEDGEVRAWGERLGLEPGRHRVSSSRTIAAPRTIARSFPNATCRGQWLKPQSGTTTICSGGAYRSARRIEAATSSGVSTKYDFTSITPTPIVRSSAS